MANAGSRCGTFQNSKTCNLLVKIVNKLCSYPFLSFLFGTLTETYVVVAVGNQQYNLALKMSSLSMTIAWNPGTSPAYL